ncbi:NADH dehydrogenase [ubiquinone] 1 alpha subcomplex assembly factor 2-like [Littorina saxatilis]|uniref:NADH dehydrogenase [ubiquinone] 1 alpha subcomplex assembly factor 2 n=1 Tax=Littorina saxatilis TaxID=31220 RepID=A0AAN9B6K5_9CAEN
MSRAKGLISRIFANIFPPRPTKSRFVGEDHLGNRYYELDKDKEGERRGSRWVESPGMEEDPTFVPEVPVEWDSWLRRRRNVPPAQEELDRNYATMIRTQVRAKELEKTGGKASDADTNAEAPYTETVTQDSFNSKFPAYKDFETTPGQFRDKGKSQDG